MTLMLINEQGFFAFKEELEAKVASGMQVEAREPAPTMEVDGKKAKISVKGPLFPRRQAWLDHYEIEHAGYEEIIDSINSANGNKSVESIELDINSPGGYVNGMFQAMQAIEASDKPVIASVNGTAASAAYMLASQAKEINASNIMNMVGSNGVVATYYLSDRYKEVTNSDSPKKRPDVSTPEGEKAAQEELDDIYEILVEQQAKGRGTTVKNIKKNYGKGAMMTARTALEKGMIDRIGAIENTNQEQTGAKKMNLEEFRSEHSALHSQIVADAEKSAVEKERKRINAHLRMGRVSNAMDVAVEAIESGAGLDDEYQSKYMEAKMNAMSIGARDEERTEDLESNMETSETMTEEEELEKELAQVDPRLLCEAEGK